MNVRLNYSIDFTTINVFADKIVPNIYHCDVSLLTNTEESYAQNIAFERLKYFIWEIFEGSVLIKYDNPNVEAFTGLIPEKIIEMPENPFDQIVGMVLFCKLNSIFEEMLLIEELKISSRVGGEIVYNIDLDDNFTTFAAHDSDSAPWWLKPNLLTTSVETEEDASWEDLSLSWDAEINNAEYIFVEEEGTEEISEETKLSIIGSLDELTQASDSIIKQANELIVSKNKTFSPTILSGGKDKK